MERKGKLPFGGLGFRVLGLGFIVQGLGFGGSGFRVQGGCRGQGLGVLGKLCCSFSFCLPNRGESGC